MTWTARDLLDEVRAVLQDVDATRYKDGQIVAAYNTCVAELRRIRPDYFIGKLRDPLPAGPSINTAGFLFVTPYDIPLPEQIRLLVTTFCAGYIELMDDQFTDDKRALGLMSLLGASLGRPPA